MTGHAVKTEPVFPARSRRARQWDAFPCTTAPSRQCEMWTSPHGGGANTVGASDGKLSLSLPSPASHLSSWRCCKQGILVLLSPRSKVPWWRWGELGAVIGPSSSPEVSRYRYRQWQLLTPCRALYHETVCMPLTGHGPWSCCLFPVLGALLTKKLTQHVLKVLVTLTVLPNGSFFWFGMQHLIPERQ